MSTKMKLLTMYIVLGMVWCAINLPNLLAKAGYSSVKATGLALFRIIAWPFLAGNAAYGLIKKESKKNGSEETDSD